MFLPLLLLTLCNTAQLQMFAFRKSSHVAASSKIRMHEYQTYEHHITPVEERNPEFWKEVALEELENSIKKQQLNTNRAKNIIFFLGDGMSLNTVTAARILQGRRKNQTGEEEKLSFEKFPYTGLSKTYCTNAQVADQACSATAYLCGVKSNIMTIGVNGHVRFNNCSESMDPENHVSSIAAWAQKHGKSTGFITNTKLTDASPGGLYAHVANRFYESDTDVESFGVDPKKCMDIATQLVTQEPGRNFDIIMGGGMSKFLPNTVQDVHGNFGTREDGKNLLSLWQNKHREGVIVSNRNELMNLNLSRVTNVMGIFQSSRMDYHLKANPAKQPTLIEMTEAAIKLMKRNPNGYVLFVAGGLINVAHHQSKSAISLDETLEFAKAVERARKITSKKDTLIVTSANHGHSLTISGYPARGSDILGLSPDNFDMNSKKYLTLNYATGPKQYLNRNGKRLNLDKIKIDADFQYPSYIKTHGSHRTGDDVAIYASGPFAHLFTGVIEQSTIPHMMAYAACLGDGPTMCDERDEFPNQYL